MFRSIIHDLVILGVLAILALPPMRGEPYRPPEGGPKAGDRAADAAPADKPPAAPKPADPHRSPADVALTPDGKFAITANHTSNSASLIDLSAGRVLAEVAVGKAPWAVAVALPGKVAATANLRGDSITLFAIDSAKPALTAPAEVAVGHEPRGLAFNDSGRELFVACAGSDEIVVVDVESRKVARRFSAAGREPRGLLLWPDGRTLWALNSRSVEVVRLDRTNGEVIRRVRMDDAGNLNRAAVAADGSILIPHMVRRAFPVAKQNIHEGWVIDNRVSRLSPEPDRSLQQIALDERGDAVGDAFGVAFAAGGKHLVVTAPGTHELLAFNPQRIPWSSADPGDHIDNDLLAGPGKMRKIALGGRPLGVAVTADGRAVVANYLLDSVQVVDLASGTIAQTIRLGGPGKPSVERIGEGIFFDAKRSHAAWFSCHTCHTDGHTNGMTWDTLNDESYGNPKLTPSLRGVGHTGPWTWHGFQSDLADSVKKSMITTMQGPTPSDADVAALFAYFRTIDHPRNPNRGPAGEQSPAAQRGQALFFGKAGCSECHNGPHYTSSKTFDVKTTQEDGRFARFSPPSLRGVYARGPYLHDGRADTLDELLRRHHTPAKVGGAELSDAERGELVEFLRGL